MKLTTRFTEAAQIERIRRLLQSYSGDLDVEIQQRAVEYGNLFGYDQIRGGVLEKMPAPEIKETDTVMRAGPQKAKAPKKKSTSSSAGVSFPCATIVMMDTNFPQLIDDLFVDDASQAASSNGNNGQSSLDLIKDIFSDTPTSTPTPPAQKSNISSIMDLFGSPPPNATAPVTSSSAMGSLLGDLGSISSSPPQPVVPVGPRPLPVYKKNDLEIIIQLQRNHEGLVNVLARFKNTGFMPITGVNLQAAVPKSQKLMLSPISTSELPAGGEATQGMKIQFSKVVSFPSSSFPLLTYLSGLGTS